MVSLPTVWILGDQLNRAVASLVDRQPGDCRVLLVESDAKITSKRWHVQRLHLVLSAMAHFADRLEREGFEVDHRRAPTLAAGLAAHRDRVDVGEVIAMEPMSWDGRELLRHLDVTVVSNNQFLCSYEEFTSWVEGRKNPTMEAFYRWQRRRLDVLMDGDDPVGGRWNFDRDNREPPPKDGRAWPALRRFDLDGLRKGCARGHVGRPVIYPNCLLRNRLGRGLRDVSSLLRDRRARGSRRFRHGWPLPTDLLRG